MSSPAPLLEARDVGRRTSSGNVCLLDHVSLRLAPGERLGISGPSGAGKTLLLRALALLDPLDSGEILFHEKPVADVPDFRSQVVYLRQQPARFEGTVQQALEKPFSLAIHQNKQFDSERIGNMLEHLGRDASLLSKNLTDLSAGEAQIVALLRAVQLDPSVLLLDEPSASLDSKTKGSVELLISRWFEEGAPTRALIWVAHDSDQLQRIADRTVMLKEGRMVKENRPAQDTRSC